MCIGTAAKQNSVWRAACCVGVVHVRVPLGADEVELARELALHVETFEDGLGFHLPCPQYRENRCATYHHRPRACVNYQCELLEHLLVGEISLEVSLSLVIQARAMIDALRAQSAQMPLTLEMLRRMIQAKQTL